MPHFVSFEGSPLIPPLLYTVALFSTLILIFALIFLAIHFRDRSLSFAHKLKELLVWSSLTFLGILSLVGAIFLSTPIVISTSPINKTANVGPKSTVSINFDKPINRRTMEKFITPDVPGIWIFEDPVYTTHLYRKLTFYPDTTLDAGVEYKITLKGIKNTLQTSKPYDFEFSFKTADNPEIKKEVAKVASQTVKLSVPSYLQQHTLSCELAALKMTLAYKGIVKSEEELLAQVGVDNTPHVNGTWGNPYEQFVGNVDGSQMKDGYGVYWGPIERVAKSYGEAQAFQNGTVEMLTKAITDGHPIIIWVYSKNGKPTSWKTPTGVDVFAVAGEHAVVAVGFVGDASNPEKIIVNDPLVGQVHWDRSFFDQKWASFSQSGVIVYK